MNKVAAHYDGLVEHGDDPVCDIQPLREYMDKWDGQAFLTALRLDGTQSVLEIGVGTGRLAVRIAEDCATFCGIDLSEKAVMRARENLSGKKNVGLICGDFLTHAFSETFDVAYSSLTFMHMEDKGFAIRKAASLLKDGGRFVLSIDKNQNRQIDAGFSRIDVYPDDPENIKTHILAAGLVLEKHIQTEFAHILIAEKKNAQRG